MAAQFVGAYFNASAVGGTAVNVQNSGRAMAAAMQLANVTVAANSASMATTLAALVPVYQVLAYLLASYPVGGLSRAEGS